jgi:hypothetical protein
MLTRGRWRALLPGSESYIMQKEINRFMASRRRQLAALPRKFPKFFEGMSTAEYVRHYYGLNLCAMGIESGHKADTQNANRVVGEHFAPLNWKPCGLYDPYTLLCEETTEG